MLQMLWYPDALLEMSKVWLRSRSSLQDEHLLKNERRGATLLAKCILLTIPWELGMVFWTP